MVGLVGVILSVHDNLNHPLVCCKDDPPSVFLEFLDCLGLLPGNIRFGREQVHFKTQLVSALNPSASVGEPYAHFPLQKCRLPLEGT